MSPKDKLGKKLVCADCNSKYYDLNRNNVACPKCGSILVAVQKSKFKMAKTVEVEIDTDDTDMIDTDDDVEILPLDSLEAEFS